jgi:hypothetical protein
LIEPMRRIAQCILSNVPQMERFRIDEFLELERRACTFVTVRNWTERTTAMRHESRSSAPVNGWFDGVLKKRLRFRNR